MSALLRTFFGALVRSLAQDIGMSASIKLASK
jgi:hypothetical protein